MLPVLRVWVLRDGDREVKLALRLRSDQARDWD